MSYEDDIYQSPDFNEDFDFNSLAADETLDSLNVEFSSATDEEDAELEYSQQEYKKVQYAREERDKSLYDARLKYHRKKSKGGLKDIKSMKAAPTLAQVSIESQRFREQGNYNASQSLLAAQLDVEGQSSRAGQTQRQAERNANTKARLAKQDSTRPVLSRKSPEAIRSEALDVTGGSATPSYMSEKKQGLLDYKAELEGALYVNPDLVADVDTYIQAEEARIRSHVDGGGAIASQAMTEPQLLKQGYNNYLSDQTNMPRYVNELEQLSVFENIEAGSTSSPQKDSAGTGAASEAMKQAFKFRQYGFNEQAAIYDMLTNVTGSDDIGGLHPKSIDKAKAKFQSAIGMPITDFASQIKRPPIDGSSNDHIVVKTAYNFLKKASIYGEQGSGIEPLRTAPNPNAPSVAQAGFNKPPAVVTEDELAEKAAYNQAEKDRTEHTPIEALNAARADLKNIFAPMLVMKGYGEGLDTQEEIDAAKEGATNRAFQQLEKYIASGKATDQIPVLNLDGSKKYTEYAHALTGEVREKAIREGTLFESNPAGLPVPSEVMFQGVTYNESNWGGSGSSFTRQGFNEFLQSDESTGLSTSQLNKLNPSVVNSWVPNTVYVGNKPSPEKGLQAMAEWTTRKAAFDAQSDVNFKKYVELNKQFFKIAKTYEEAAYAKDEGYVGEDRERGDVYGKYGLQGEVAAESAYAADELSQVGIERTTYAGHFDKNEAIQQARNDAISATIEESINNWRLPSAIPDSVSVDLPEQTTTDKKRAQIVKENKWNNFLASKGKTDQSLGGANTREGMFERGTSEEGEVKALVKEGSTLDEAMFEVFGRERTNEGMQSIEDITDRGMYLAMTAEDVKRGRAYSDRTTGWNLQRRGKLTASMVLDLLPNEDGSGKSREMRELEAAVKVAEGSLGLSDFYGNKHTLLGQYGEDWMQKNFQNRTDLIVEEAFFGEIAGSPTLGATPDGQVFNKAGEYEGILEMKHLASSNTMSKSFEKYTNQLQYQMMKDKSKQAWFYREDVKGGKPILDVVKADPDIQKKLREAGERVTSLASLNNGEGGLASLRGQVKMYAGLSDNQEYIEALEQKSEAEKNQSRFPPAKKKIVVEDSSSIFDYKAQKTGLHKVMAEREERRIGSMDAVAERFSNINKASSFSGESIQFDNLDQITLALEAESKKQISSAARTGGAAAVIRATQSSQAASAAQAIQAASGNASASIIQPMGASFTAPTPEQLQNRLSDAGKEVANRMHSGDMEGQSQINKDETAAYSEDARRSTDAVKKASEAMKSFTDAVKKSTKTLGSLSTAAMKGSTSAMDNLQKADAAGMTSEEFRDMSQSLEFAGAKDGEAVLGGIAETSIDLATGGLPSFIGDVAAKSAWADKAYGEAFPERDWDAWSSLPMAQKAKTLMSDLSKIKDPQARAAFRKVHNIQAARGVDDSRLEFGTGKFTAQDDAAVLANNEVNVATAREVTNTVENVVNVPYAGQRAVALNVASTDLLRTSAATYSLGKEATGGAMGWLERFASGQGFDVDKHSRTEDASIPEVINRVKLSKEIKKSDLAPGKQLNDMINSLKDPQATTLQSEVNVIVNNNGDQGTEVLVNNNGDMTQDFQNTV